MSIYQGEIKVSSGGGGKSAYQYAVQGGFEGTEQEFYELLGSLDEISAGGGDTTNAVLIDGGADIILSESLTELIEPDEEGRYNIEFTYDESDDDGDYLQVGEADERYAAVAHASRHAIDGEDPLTAEDIGSVRIYTRLSELGLSESTATMDGIVGAMQDGSMAIMEVVTSWTAAEMPIYYATLTVFKKYPSRCYAILCGTNGSTMFIGAFNNGVFGGWHEIALSDDYLPLTGGKLTGDLEITDGHGRFHAWDTGMQIESLVIKSNTTNRSAITINNNSSLVNMFKAFRTVDGTTTQYNIHHAGNKPTGTYTGTGAAQTISIDCIGSFIMIYSSGIKGGLIVSPSGGIYGSTTYASTAIKFENGQLIIGTTNDVYNASGTTYYYYIP